MNFLFSYAEPYAIAVYYPILLLLLGRHF